MHFNEFGNWITGELIKPYLVRDSSLDADPPVCEFAVGEDVQWHDGRLVLPFDGNRVDLIAAKGGDGQCRVLVDGNLPSSLPACYSFSRPNDIRGRDWPWQVASMIRIDSEAPLIEETWTARISDISEDCSEFRFEIEGSKTGPDGSGEAGERFVSNSGRVVIEPEYWFLAQARKLSGSRFEPGNEVQWHVNKHAVDQYRVPRDVDPAREHATTVAQGLDNAPHTLTLEGDAPISAIRIYRPLPLAV
jgi:hypothetical protein